MIPSHKLTLAVVLAGAAWACSSGDPAPSTTPGNTTDPNTGITTDPNGNPVQVPVTEKFKPTPEQALNFMRYLGPSLLGRVRTDAEETRITA